MAAPASVPGEIVKPAKLSSCTLLLATMLRTSSLRDRTKVPTCHQRPARNFRRVRDETKESAAVELQTDQPNKAIRRTAPSTSSQVSSSPRYVLTSLQSSGVGSQLASTGGPHAGVGFAAVKVQLAPVTFAVVPDDSQAASSSPEQEIVLQPFVVSHPAGQRVEGVPL